MFRSFQCGYFRRMTTGSSSWQPLSPRYSTAMINPSRFVIPRRMIGSSSSSNRLAAGVGGRRGGRFIVGGCGVGVIGIGSYYYYHFFSNSSHNDKCKVGTTSAATKATLCEASEQDAGSREADDGNEMVMLMEDDTKQTIVNQLVKMQSQLYATYRILLRCINLLVVFTPVMALYPVYYYFCYYGNNDDANNGENSADRDAHEIVLGIAGNTTTNDGTVSTLSYRERFIQYYYTICLFCVELSGGATIIKFLQWMSSRPDLFGHEFCQVFCKLQDHTTPHNLHYTEQCMRESYGTDWKESITLHEVIGSGCIGQVYRGTVKVGSSDNDGDGDDDSSKFTNAATKNESSSSPQYREVAIKVIHPNVRNDIDTDMDIIRHIFNFIKYINPSIQKHCQYLNINGVLDEFQKLLKLQMDLRYEVCSLDKWLYVVSIQ